VIPTFNLTTTSFKAQKFNLKSDIIYPEYLVQLAHHREVSMSPNKETQKSTAKDKQSRVFSEEERAAMKERA
jgi:hypothetical protein